MAMFPSLDPRDHIRPIEGWRAMSALLRDKEDTAQVFRVIDAFAGGTRRSAYRRACASSHGRMLLTERPNLLAALMDRARLAALPDGALGRRYHDFTARERISADGLIAASEAAGSDGRWTEEELWFGARMRDQHDLWHVVSGYGREALGELALLAFTHAQTGNRGISVIVKIGAMKFRQEAPQIPVRAILAEARARGRSCGWLPEQRWEDLLATPLDDVRAHLGLAAAPVYDAAAPAARAMEGASPPH